MQICISCMNFFLQNALDIKMYHLFLRQNTLCTYGALVRGCTYCYHHIFCKTLSLYHVLCKKHDHRIYDIFQDVYHACIDVLFVLVLFVLVLFVLVLFVLVLMVLVLVLVMVLVLAMVMVLVLAMVMVLVLVLAMVLVLVFV